MIGNTADGSLFGSRIMPDGSQVVIIDRALYDKATAAANTAMARAVDSVKASVRKRNDQDAA
jgi:hypothetical protein